MAEIKKLLDEFGIILEGNKILPEEFKLKFLSALAELENNECHKSKSFLTLDCIRLKEFSKLCIGLILIKFLAGDCMSNIIKMAIWF